MSLDQILFIALSLIYIASLLVAFRKRDSFPLGEIFTLLLIVGVGFTAAVYFFVPQSEIVALQKEVSVSQIGFVLGYIVFLSFLLTRKRRPFLPQGWEDHFIKKHVHALIYKLTLYVFIPLAILHFVWDVPLADLGLSFKSGDHQARSTILLILLLGGFNFFAGREAAPIRSGQFTAKQITAGFMVAFVWDVLEAGLVEEFFFRGLLQTRIMALTQSPWIAIGITSLIFGLAHAPGIYLRGAESSMGEKPSIWNAVLYSVLVLSVAGWFMGLLFWRTQSLLVPILVHGGIDAVASTSQFITQLGLFKNQEKHPSASSQS